LSKHLLSVLDFTSAEFSQLIDKAISAKNISKKKVIPQLLSGKNIGIYFNRPSTRTRTSFSLAASNLGASVISYQAGEMQLTTGESIADTAAVLAEYLDILVMRCDSISQLEPYMQNQQLSVINALTDEEHPTQALADYMTIKEQFSRFEGIKILFMGEGGNIATSFLLAGARIPGLKMYFITPERYAFKDSVIRQAYELAQQSGAQIHYHHDPKQLPESVDVVYTSRWRSMGEEKAETDWLSQYKDFQITTTLFSTVSHAQSIMMHDLPAERGAEVDQNILNSSSSVIFQQAANKLATAKVIMPWLLTKD
jgi:ornithine carbamoyltransferase